MRPYKKGKTMPLLATEMTALEIDSPKCWEIVTALVPTFAELSYEEVHGSFLIPTFVGSDGEVYGNAIVPPDTVGKHFDHIEPGARLKLVQLIRAKK